MKVVKQEKIKEKQGYTEEPEKQYWKQFHSGLIFVKVLSFHSLRSEIINFKLK